MNQSQRYLIWPVEGGYVVRDTERDHEVVSDVLSKSAAQKEARSMNGEADIAIPRVPGAKWLRECTYISGEVKREVVRVIGLAKEAFPDEAIMIRPASYIGTGSGLVTICYGAGQRIFRTVG